MDFDTQQAFALILSELKEIKTEMQQDISEIKNNMATKNQIAMTMEAINAINKEIEQFNN